MADSFPIDVVRCDLRQVIDALDSGLITSESLCREYLRRIARDNKQGRELRAVLELAPENDILHRAREMDGSRASRRSSLLHGIPILLKDVIATDVSLGMHTTAGTPALLQSQPLKNAPIVDRLLQTGMIILGKANMSMFSGYFHPDAPRGWSPLGGQTRSAFGADLDVSGSSTGCAVAISAGFCGVALGSQTNGSITSPSERAGIVGMKPTHGFTSNEGVIPISRRLDTLGPMGKSAFDIAAVLDVLSPVKAIMKGLDDLTPVRIGSCDMAQWAHDMSEDEQVLFMEAIDCLSDSIKVKEVKVKHHDEIAEQDLISRTYIQTQENDWASYLAGCEGEICSLAELVEYQASHPVDCFHPSCPGQDYLEEALSGGPHPVDEQLAKINVILEQARESFEEILRANELDAVMWPYEGGPSFVAALGGYPTCTVPFKMGQNGRPFGVIFVGAKEQDHRLLSVIRHCESVFPKRPIPSGW